MKLVEALKKVNSEGYRKAYDEYCFHGKKTLNFLPEARHDNDDWGIEYQDNFAYLYQLNDVNSWNITEYKPL